MNKSKIADPQQQSLWKKLGPHHRRDRRRSEQQCQARGFYMILAVATLMGVLLNLTPIDPIKALYWSAVINGVIAVPIMAVMMLMAARPEIMGQFVISQRLHILGWLATAVMALAVLVMLAMWAS